MINIESIKGKIRSLAEKKNLKSQEVLQIYFFERFLDRLSKSSYKSNFVIKGDSDPQKSQFMKIQINTYQLNL